MKLKRLKVTTDKRRLELANEKDFVFLHKNARSHIYFKTWLKLAQLRCNILGPHARFTLPCTWEMPIISIPRKYYMNKCRNIRVSRYLVKRKHMKLFRLLTIIS